MAIIATGISWRPSENCDGYRGRLRTSVGCDRNRDRLRITRLAVSETVVGLNHRYRLRP